MVSADYQLLDKNTLPSSDYDKYLKSYPDLANGTIYKLNTKNSDEISKLNSIFARPVLIVSFIESGAAEQFFSGQLSLPPGVDPFTVLEQVPPTQLEAIRQAADTQLSSLPQNVINQYAISYLATEYKTIGINVNQMQIGYMMRIGGLMLLLTLASIAASVVVGFMAARVAAGFGRDTRRKIFTKVENYSSKEFD